MIGQIIQPIAQRAIFLVRVFGGILSPRRGLVSVTAPLSLPEPDSAAEAACSAKRAPPRPRCCGADVSASSSPILGLAASISFMRNYGGNLRCFSSSFIVSALRCAASSFKLASSALCWQTNPACRRICQAGPGVSGLSRFCCHAGRESHDGAPAPSKPTAAPFSRLSAEVAPVGRALRVSTIEPSSSGSSCSLSTASAAARRKTPLTRALFRQF